MDERCQTPFNVNEVMACQDASFIHRNSVAREG